MTTLDQVRLLETKVESAVGKIQQLQAENDALRNKCAELTNALDSKTEQLLAFTTNKEEIEDGIKKALDRLNYIETSVLGSETTVNPDGQDSPQLTSGEDSQDAGEQACECQSSEESDSDSSVYADGVEESENNHIYENCQEETCECGDASSEVAAEGQPQENDCQCCCDEANDNNNENPESPVENDCNQNGSVTENENMEAGAEENKNVADDADDTDQDAFEYDIF